MIGAISGDIIGSAYEHNPIKTKTFDLFGNGNTFTDDTVLTIAVADAILTGCDYGTVIADYAERYPKAGYGSSFKQWVKSWDRKPYNSFGNGSAMRVSPIGWAFHTVREVLLEAKRSAEVTHNHPEGIKGAQATALAVFRARTGTSKAKIKTEIEKRFGYDLNRTLDQIRPTYTFDVTCQGSVPESIIAFLESASYEDAVRNAVSLGGDADTQACIAGGIAEAFYGGVPVQIEEYVVPMLPPDLRTLADSFRKKYQSGDQRHKLATNDKFKRRRLAMLKIGPNHPLKKGFVVSSMGSTKQSDQSSTKPAVKTSLSETDRAKVNAIGRGRVHRDPPLKKIGVVSPKRMKELKVYWRMVLKGREEEGSRRREYPSGGTP